MGLLGKYVWVFVGLFGWMDGRALFAEQKSRGREENSAYNQLYNPKTIETFSGNPIVTDEVVPMPGMEPVVYVIVQTRYADITVHLCPKYYLEQNNIKISPGDSLEVTGSKATLDGKVVIIAKKIKVNGRILALRDNGGKPLWIKN